MSEISAYLEAIKERYALASDYALAKRLGIAQPDANLIRRGLKIPKPEICMKIAKLLDKNPVELLLIAQKEKAPSSAKQYWTLALTAVERPRPLSKKYLAQPPPSRSRDIGAAVRDESRPRRRGGPDRRACPQS